MIDRCAREKRNVDVVASDLYSAPFAAVTAAANVKRAVEHFRTNDDSKTVLLYLYQSHIMAPNRYKRLDR